MLLGAIYPQISDLMRGRIERFIGDMSVNLPAHVGLHGEMRYKQAAELTGSVVVAFGYLDKEEYLYAYCL